MIKGKTKSGFHFNVDERRLNDWRLLKAITESESKDESVQVKATAKMVNLLLGDAGEEDLMDFIASKSDGYVPTESILKEVIEIFQSCSKNSQSSPQ